ncbi:uncharacterized protein VICG_01616 [Vittaforma corneae ATCC 50505]|uniref:Uncharacterized protein n=1 Tax=Vittaforma corneae (strain ATCC 50505) TaxID=993615 RepID=L2GLJ4_VITCO|nr:uncharacterized protein VICG_01616 [Vittaforma corneae ATCC 50505]ELA41375.1 hypothetical protein VICG_01616 [Vittaforma corneae ATCC 50505]
MHRHRLFLQHSKLYRGFAYFCIALLFVLDCFCLRTLLSYQNPQTFIFNHIALIILVWMSHALLYLSIVLSQLLLDSAGWIPFWDTQKDSALLCVFLISEFLCIVLSVCLMAVFPSLGVFSLLFVLGFALKLICSLLACSTVAQTLHCPLSAKECTYESVLECKQTIISLKY